MNNDWPGGTVFSKDLIIVLHWLLLQPCLHRLLCWVLQNSWSGYEGYMPPCSSRLVGYINRVPLWRTMDCLWPTFSSRMHWVFLFSNTAKFILDLCMFCLKIINLRTASIGAVFEQTLRAICIHGGCEWPDWGHSKSQGDLWVALEFMGLLCLGHSEL